MICFKKADCIYVKREWHSAALWDDKCMHPKRKLLNKSILSKLFNRSDCIVGLYDNDDICPLLEKRKDLEPPPPPPIRQKKRKRKKE